MPIYRKESLEALRQRVDLAEVLSSYIELKRTGASFKALCPFHDEKTQSFTVQKGDSHYHCFGCGAHGDAIQFLMNHQKMSFHEAVENLAQRFGIHLEVVEDGEQSKGPNKAHLKEALELAADYFHFMLLNTHEGHEVLQYLYSRGLDLNFIKQFRIGLAPKTPGLFRKVMHAKFIKDDTLLDAGLLTKTSTGSFRDFFSDRITFPICAASGNVIGFSARKYKEETFGGKYVNTSETVLFKKSRVLFGLNYCRRRIAKERKAIIVEGQLDALRLIYSGFNITVAGQGTAFGEGHVKELVTLGITQVFLALDADKAGEEATVKIGDLFQRESIEVYVVKMPSGSDPDTFIVENGPEAFSQLLEKSIDYLTFLVEHYSKTMSMDSPAAKNQLVTLISKQIRLWENPLMVHESLRKLAQLTHVPESIVGVGQEHIQSVYIKKQASVGLHNVDPDRILESDLIRWILLLGGSKPELIELARANLIPEDFRVTVCRHIYQTFMENTNHSHTCDLLELVSRLDDVEGQLVLSELLQKKVNKEKADLHFTETIQKILSRNWMERREDIKMKIQSGNCTDDEALDLVRQFDDLKRNPPQVKMIGEPCQGNI